MEQETVGIVSRLFDVGITVGILGVGIYLLYKMFRKQLDTSMDTLKEELNIKRAEVERKDKQIEEATVKYEAMTRETLKAYGSMNQVLQETLQITKMLPDNVAHKVKEEINTLNNKIQQRLTDISKEISRKDEKRD